MRRSSPPISAAVAATARSLTWADQPVAAGSESGQTGIGVLMALLDLALRLRRLCRGGLLDLGLRPAGRWQEQAGCAGQRQRTALPPPAGPSHYTLAALRQQHRCGI